MSADFELKKAELQTTLNRKKADADFAYELERHRLNQELKTEEGKVKLIEKDSAIELQKKEIDRVEQELEATVRKPAAAEQYRLEAEAKGMAEAKRVQGIIKKIRGRIDKAVDSLILKAKKFAGKLLRKSHKKEAPAKEAPEEEPPETADPQHDADLEFGLAAIDEEEKRYLEAGKISREEAEKVAATVKSKHPVFKSITVVDAEERWDYRYTATPGGIHKGERKEEGEDLEKARKLNTFTRMMLQETIGLKQAAALKRINEWKAEGKLWNYSEAETGAGVAYTFDKAKAGQKPKSQTQSNRVKYGYVNPTWQSKPGMKILSKGITDATRDEEEISAGNTGYFDKVARYDSQDPKSTKTDMPRSQVILERAIPSLRLY